MAWEPTLQSTYKGTVVWNVPENHQISVTLFKDPRTNELEDKDWSFVLEDVRKSFSIWNDHKTKKYLLHGSVVLGSNIKAKGNFSGSDLVIFLKVKKLI